MSKLNFEVIDCSNFKLLGYSYQTEEVEFETDNGPQKEDNEIYKLYFKTDGSYSNVKLTEGNDLKPIKNLLIEVTLVKENGPCSSGWISETYVTGSINLIDLDTLENKIKIRKVKEGFYSEFCYNYFIGFINRIDDHEEGEISHLVVENTTSEKFEVSLSINWIGADHYYKSGSIYLNKDVFEEEYNEI